MPGCRPDGPNAGTAPVDTSRALYSRSPKFLKLGRLLELCGQIRFGTRRALSLAAHIRTQRALRTKERMNALYCDLSLRRADEIRLRFCLVCSTSSHQEPRRID